MPKVIVPASVVKQVKKLPQRMRERVVERIEQLSTESRPADSKKLVALGLYRIRAGDYRVVYIIDDVNQNVVIVRVGHRREVYR